MIQKLIVCVSALFAALPTYSAVQVTTVPCGLQLTCDPIEGASTYRVSRIYAPCAPLWQSGPEFIANSKTNEYLVTSNPAFTGYFMIEAFNAAGQSLGVQASTEPGYSTSYPVAGSPWIPTGSESLTAWVGEHVELAASGVPNGNTVQWTRNSVPIAGATASNIVWVVTADDAGAVFAPLVTNSCGTSTGIVSTISLVPQAPPSGSIVWRGVRARSTSVVEPGGHPCGGTGCCTSTVTSIVSGFPSSTCIQPSANGFSVDCGVPGANGGTNAQVSRLRSYVPISTTLTVSGVNTASTRFQGTHICGGVSGSITGPVNITLPTAVGAWGPMTYQLPSGEYIVETRANSGGGCPSTGSAACQGWTRMTLNAAIASQEITVPTTHPTIQAAIDSVPTGAARTVNVAAGVYHESFSLNGKNVVVRGAPNHATILDGTGLATSIARFSGAEPETAGVENIVFRNGSVGSLIYPKAPFRVGGALYGSGSAAFIRNCRFEANEADFGGAVYLFRSTVLVEGCVFVGNSARSESGALQLYESSGTVASSLFSGNSASLFGSGAASAFKVVGARVAGDTVAVTDCTIESGTGGQDVAAVEFYENLIGTPGTLRISGTTITGNSGGGGLRTIGAAQVCVLTGGSVVCGNSPRNISGPFLIEGSATVCDCLADVTFDGVVNGGDLGVVLAAWGAAGSNGAGDVTRDGFVNANDLAAVLASWGTCP
jgi:hypothetical protein